MKHHFGRFAVQPSLKISAPQDKFEREAEHVADQVMSQPVGQRQVEEDEENIQLKLESPRATPARQPSINSMGINGSGQPLSENTRSFFESRLGHDFSHVRIHTDQQAAEAAQSIHARAFTFGRHIVFAPNQYRTNSFGGQHLLAHELTHVIQQTGEMPHGQTPVVSRTPANTIQRAIQNVQPAELSTFFSQPEDLLPSSILDKFLREPGLMATQRTVIRDLIGLVQRAEAPLTANEFEALVLGHESDRGTALIICHNVTKALSRGQSPINWDNVSREPDPLVYTLDGMAHTFDSTAFHRDAHPYSSRGEESVFYAMLSIDEFDNRDEGDWYHYYALAATSYYQASGGLQPDDPAQQDPNTQFTGDLVRRTIQGLRDSRVTSSPAYEAWLMANALSFLEGGHFGHSQAEVDRESDVHIQGASRGLALEDKIPEENWEWQVPRAGSISLPDLANFQFSSDLISFARRGVHGNFHITIVSGTTPSHWNETPDPYVKLPGLFTSHTTTQHNTTTPTWNDRLTTLPYSRLNPVNLELRDEDVAFHDLITTFSDDLRPQGQRSQTFSLTSSGSTLEVQVEAVGNVVLAGP
ncbi:MAG: DUF4157 domain-containing protein [Ardenticatenaceae bacterium]|nr:DUF4157 domain-containing protein [Ardenticatenaceae bacterium]